MEERRERWWSKHKSAEEAKGVWRGMEREECDKTAKESRVGGGGEEWRELISIDHRRQLHYQHLLDTRWIHKLLPLACSGLPARVCMCVPVYACMRTWWITFKVDFASGCQNDDFNPVRLDFPPSRIRLEEEKPDLDSPNYWQKQPYCNQTTLNLIVAEFFCPDPQQLYVDASP